MNTNPAHSHLFHRYLAFAEMLSLALLVTGLFLKLSGSGSKTIFLIAILGLSAIYFIQAFKPPSDAQDEPLGFSDLLCQSIIPKVLNISLAVSLNGILFAILGLEGGKNMQIIGGISCMAGVLILGYFSITGVKNLRVLFPLVLRVVMVLATNLYLFIQTGR